MHSSSRFQQRYPPWNRDHMTRNPVDEMMDISPASDSNANGIDLSLQGLLDGTSLPRAVHLVWQPFFIPSPLIGVGLFSIDRRLLICGPRGFVGNKGDAPVNPMGGFERNRYRTYLGCVREFASPSGAVVAIPGLLSSSEPRTWFGATMRRTSCDGVSYIIFLQKQDPDTMAGI